MSVHIVRYFNLTNGILAVDRLEGARFIRLQSTFCEQKRWADILLQLDADFLLHLALGFECVVVDFSNGSDVPRAIWQGCEWVRYATARNWFDNPASATVRGHDCTDYFAQCYAGLTSRALTKLRYFRRFARPGGRIVAQTAQTTEDGNYAAMVAHLNQLLVDAAA